MRIFLDVGAHYGEALDVALDPAWGFDRIYSFEPAQVCLPLLRGFRDPRLRIVPAGMSNMDGEATLFGSGRLGASVYADKAQAEGGLAQETIALVDATDWMLANTSAHDEIYLKLNCEGSECDVLEDMLDGGVIDRVRSIYVDFDVRKIPSQAHRQEVVERRLREAGRDFVTPDGLTSPAGSAAVREWLSVVLPRTPAASGRLRYRLGLHRPPYLLATSVARKVLPRSTYSLAAQRFGAQARRRASASA